MKKKIGLGLVIGLLIALDQASKWWIQQHIQLGQVRPFLKGIFSLTHLHNSGAAFSMLENQQVFFTIMTVLVMLAAFYYLLKHLNDSIWKVTALVLIIAGGLGNFIDRLQYGYVIDMIHLDFVDFAIFNVADSYLTVGVILLMLIMLKEEKNASSN